MQSVSSEGDIRSVEMAGLDDASSGKCLNLMDRSFASDDPCTDSCYVPRVNALGISETILEEEDEREHQ